MEEHLPSVLWHCWLSGRKGIRPVKKWGDGGGGHWLVWMELHPAGWSVYLPLLIFPCTVKSRCSLLAPAHPGGPGKRAVKQLGCGGGYCGRADNRSAVTSWSRLVLMAHQPIKTPMWGKKPMSLWVTAVLAGCRMVNPAGNYLWLLAAVSVSSVLYFTWFLK